MVIQERPQESQQADTESAAGGIEEEIILIDDERGDYYEIKEKPEGPKINWEGQIVPEGPWLEKTLITIGSTEIKNEHVVWGSGIIIAIIILSVLICFAVSWWKRKFIVTQARRASTWVRRSLNRQVYGRSTDEFGHAEAFQAPNKIGRNKREIAFIRDLFDHHQDLNNLDKPNDTSKSIEDPEINLIKQEINKRERIRAHTIKYQTLNHESFREQTDKNEN